jgi:hypothetical protein
MLVCALMLLAKIDTEPEEVIGVDKVTSTWFWVNPEIVPPVPDWPMVNEPMLPLLTPMIPLNDQVLSNV